MNTKNDAKKSKPSPAKPVLKDLGVGKGQADKVRGGVAMGNEPA
jgi:hypothetical protein